jgi:two-component system, sensor histidine kinase and response regulator
VNAHDTHIIIIETTRKDAEHLRDLLRDIGFPRVTLFASLEEARMLWEHIHPGLAIIDVALHATELGRRAISFLMAHYDIPFLAVVNGETDRALIEGTRYVGAIARPLDESRVRSAIEAALTLDDTRQDEDSREIWSLSTLQALHDPLIVCDHERMITFLNPAAEALTGWKLSEVVRTRLSRVFSPLDPFASRNRAHDAGASFDAPQQYTQGVLETKDGRRIPIEHVATPVYNHRDAFAGYVIILRDVRDRIRMEQRLARNEDLYRTLAETSRDLIVITGRDGRLEFVNASAAGFFGMHPVEMIARQYTEFFPTSLEDPQQRDHEIVFTTASPRRTDQRVIIKGRVCWLTTWLIPILDENDAVRAVMSVSRDTIEGHALPEDAARSNLKLHQLNERKDRLLSILSHDLRGPFHALLGFCELLQDEGERLHSDYVRAYTRELQLALRKQHELLENVLAWSRIQLGEKSASREAFDVHALIRELFEVFREHAEHKQVKLHLSAPDHLTIVSDPFMMRSVLYNLLSNAVKFTPAGGSVRVTAAVEQDACRVTVRDTGVGIDAEQLATLFDLAAVSSTPGTNNEPGTGLGLALCKEMLERHEGVITVDSFPGAGSTFEVVIPVSVTA